LPTLRARLLLVEADSPFNDSDRDLFQAQVGGVGSRLHELERFVESAVHLPRDHALRVGT
jgi:hypothetical protein